MTAVARAATAQPYRRPGTLPAPARSAPARPRLRPVAAPTATRSRVPFVMLCIAVLAAALLGALVLNTTMAGDAYEARRLDIEIARLVEQEQDFAATLEQLGSPQNLSTTARSLGMVPAPSLAFLRLSDGTVLGQPAPAPGG